MNFLYYKQMLQQTETNYNVAINYYKQKELAFKKAVAKNSEDTWEAFQFMLKEKSQLFGKYILERAQEVIRNGQYTNEQKKEDKIFSIYIDELFKTRTKNKEGVELINYSTAGYVFEKFMAENAMSSAQMIKLIEFAPRVCDELVAQHIGAISQKSAITKYKKFIRSDIAYSSNKISKDNKMELINFIDIENIPSEISTGDYLLSAIAAENIDQTIFGFQLKAYQTLNDKRWAQSKVLADQIKAIFTQSKLEEKTWSSNYAVNYPIYYLSKFLINIINPVNVGTITLNGIEWISDMLQHYRFYLEVTWEELSEFTPAEDIRGGGVEVIPDIETTEILLRPVKNNIWKGLAANGFLKKSVGHNKKIKVASIRNVI